jgi:hypothetical protein
VSVRYNMILCVVVTIKHMAMLVKPIVPESHLTQTEPVKNNGGQKQFEGIGYICALELIINDYEFRSFKSVLPRGLLD